MRFDDLDRKMRVFETAHDHCALPGLYLVARLDGRAFTHFTRDVCPMEKPFDVRFRDAMLATAEHLMDCGFLVGRGSSLTERDMDVECGTRPLEVRQWAAESRHR
jgi:hypothetical protein